MAIVRNPINQRFIYGPYQKALFFNGFYWYLVENRLFLDVSGHPQIFFKGKSFSLDFLSHTVLFHNFMVSKFIQSETDLLRQISLHGSE